MARAASSDKSKARLYWVLSCALAIAALACGCKLLPKGGVPGPPITSGSVRLGPPQNPLFVSGLDPEFVHNQVVDEIDNYFKVQREERVRDVGGVLTEGRVESFPQVGGTIFEPWRKDSTPGFEKLHATLQSIRRRALVRIIPVEGGTLLDVAVYKELEDLKYPERSSVGDSTMRYDTSLVRPQGAERLPPGSLGWIPQGRDASLEQRILSHLRGRLNLGDVTHLPRTGDLDVNVKMR